MRFYTDDTFDAADHEFEIDDVVPEITGALFGLMTVNEYQVELPSGVDLTGGFLSIVDATDSDCWFLWVDAAEPFGQSHRSYGDTWVTDDYSYAFCLGGTAK